MKLSWRYDGGFPIAIVGCIGILGGIIRFFQVSFGFVNVSSQIDVIINLFMISFMIGFGSLAIYISHQIYLNERRERDCGK